MMKPTTRRQPSLERCAAEQLRALATPHRFRVRLDVEGFPVIPARYGQIECPSLPALCALTPGWYLPILRLGENVVVARGGGPRA